MSHRSGQQTRRPVQRDDTPCDRAATTTSQGVEPCIGNDELRRDTVEKLLSLASAYRGLNRKQLALALGRDQTKLAPPTGNPKLDYLVRLAEVLDWQVGDVAEAIWVPETLPTASQQCGADYDVLNDRARAAHREGNFNAMIEAAQAMRLAARTPHERALAALRESGGWNGLGRYVRELETIRRGMAETNIEPDTLLLLRVNLANSYYTLGYHTEARAMARDLIERLEMTPATGRAARAAHAFAYFVLGQASCGLMDAEPAFAQSHARAAVDSLSASASRYHALAAEYDNPAWLGIANTCRAGLLEALVQLGEIPASDAVAELLAGLEHVVDASDGLAGDRLESYGWWCVSGCKISLRHSDHADLVRRIAIFTNKGYEIADRLNNWAMRERLFTLEYTHRRRSGERNTFDWTIDGEEVRMIVGTMGRFPSFRTTGWKILESATVVNGQ